MTRTRRLRGGTVAATVLLVAATVGLASVPPRPLRSALTVVHTLSFRVATDWLAVVALLAVAERYVGAGRLDRAVVWRLAALVALGGLAVEVSPFVRLVVEPAPVGTDRLVRGLVAAVQRALFPAGLFLATVAGAVTLRDRIGTRPGLGGVDALPLSPSPGPVPRLAPAAVRQSLVVLAAVAGGAFALEAGARVAVGAPHFWLVVVDAAVGTLAGFVDYAVLVAAFLVLAVDGPRVRTLVGGVVGVWAAVFVLSFAVAALGAVLGVGLVGVTTTTMGAVEGSTLGEWPTPHSWAILLRLSTFVAAGVGLAAIQRSHRSTPPRRGADTTESGSRGTTDPRAE